MDTSYICIYLISNMGKYRKQNANIVYNMMLLEKSDRE